MKPVLETSNLTNNLVVLWKAPLVMLGVDQLTVDGNVEHTPATFNELRTHAKLTLNGGRQTGSLRRVVSHHAIFN